MNDYYRSFVDSCKHIALERGLTWDLSCNAHGKVAKEQRWDLTGLAGMVPPPTIWLSEIGFYKSALDPLNRICEEKGLSPLSQSAMSQSWRDLYLAVIINEILVKRNKPKHATENIGRHVRVMAACANEKNPWEITSEDVQLAYNVALGIGASGKLASNFAMVIRLIFDGLHIADNAPLARFCIPYRTSDAQAAQHKVETLQKSVNTHRNMDRVRKELQQRKRSERLPEEKAFWELVRIVFTEMPQTFADAIRFAQLKIGIITGLRVGEYASIPYDWKRWREYLDTEGRPAGERGGISKSLMIRYFAEKQDDEGTDGVILYETAQHVPEMFQDIVQETLDEIADITQPLRERLKKQTETGSLLPEYNRNDLLHITEVYTRITGNIQFTNAALPQELANRYRETFDPTILNEIWDYQNSFLSHTGHNRNIIKSWIYYIKNGYLTSRDSHGNISSKRLKWSDLYFRVDELEDFIRRHIPTKIPDLYPFTLSNGAKLYPHELLFLMPVRSLVDNRNGGIIDINRYFAVGRSDPANLQYQLGLRQNNLFSRYGETEEDRAYKLETHSLRHLQNTELFRLGVVDAIITKRFRKSVAQSYEYDHRSLAEELDHIDIPDTAEERMGPRAQEALKMIKAGKVRGPIVDEFHRIQHELGDDSAFDYLEAEADGLHVTPYGFCLNSFTVDPCPKHLECFNGCRHLATSQLPEQQNNLKEMRDRMARVVEKIEAKPVASRNIGWQNQLEHARTRLENIEKALQTPPGTKPFPDGPDLFQSVESQLGNTIMDTARRLSRAED